jgi:hypothetical protein
MNTPSTEFRPGQEIIVPWGNSGTQRAKIVAISGGRVAVRCYRAKSKKWNIKCHHYDLNCLKDAIATAAARNAR